jgi:4-hydroxybenzoate polyprenyltransferase
MLILVLALGGAWFIGWHLAWQMRMLDIDDWKVCMHLFRSNRNAGLIPVIALAAAVLA